MPKEDGSRAAESGLAVGWVVAELLHNPALCTQVLEASETTRGSTYGTNDCSPLQRMLRCRQRPTRLSFGECPSADTYATRC